MIPFPIATPQGCDIQTFYGFGSFPNPTQATWNKPVGVSHVYMMLIGAGGNGDGSTGGGSGAVTVWYGAAQHVPNSLVVSAAEGPGSSTVVSGRFRSSALVTLLTAGSGGSAGVAGVGMDANYFTASGFYNSNFGQTGTSGNVSASSITFLSGGGGNTSFNLIANYGYSLTTATDSLSGSFMMQPIIVGLGGKDTGRGGIGCGGGRSVASGRGGPGMVLIASW
jgi:hypothetical protein